MEFGFGTKAVHASNEPDPSTGALMTPIYMTSTYLQEAPGVNKGFDYTRANNPNFVVLEKALAALENAHYATVFASGLGALTALISTLSPGNKVIALDGVYGGTFRLFTQVFNKFGIEYISVNPEKTVELELIVKREQPKWLFLETPTNPLLDIYDIKTLSAIAKRYRTKCIVDNTFATPYCQNPLDLGADIVWHSTTKYIGGHSDVVGGVVMTNNKDTKEKMDFARKALGLNPSPFDAWLIARGVKTLGVRMEKHCKNGLAFAKYLEKHPLVKKVYYPGLKSHPKQALAKKQMHGFSGVVSAEFDLPLEGTKRLISSLKLFALAESLGGVESLVCLPLTMTHASLPQDEFERIGLTDGLIRFSLGIEEVDDLIHDLEAALKKK